MTPSANRSFTEPRGLKASILTKRFTPFGARRLILTTGVLPTVSRMLSYFRPMLLSNAVPAAATRTVCPLAAASLASIWPDWEPRFAISVRRHDVSVDPAARHWRFADPVAVVARNHDGVSRRIDAGDDSDMAATSSATHDSDGSDLRTRYTLTVMSE